LQPPQWLACADADVASIKRHDEDVAHAGAARAISYPRVVDEKVYGIASAQECSVAGAYPVVVPAAPIR